MLIRVATDQLRPGMFIADVNCSWLRNPFWRSSILLTDRQQIAQIRDAGIDEVVIDDARGLGLALGLAGVATPRSFDDRGSASPDLRSHEPTRLPAKNRERRARPRLARDEYDRARHLAERSKNAVMKMFGEARLGRAVHLEEVTPLVDEIAASVARDAEAMLTVTRLKNKDEYTYMHSVAVCALMVKFARHLGLTEPQVRDLGVAGLLHDIGKMAMPTALLDKPGALTDDEMALIRTHPAKGHALLAVSPHVPAIALDVCLHHHERMDGWGYPFGLDGAQISVHARMSAICDVYDAVTSDRAYKAPWSPNQALARMLEWEGHFDRELLDAFVASIGIPPLGAIVRLHSNRLALVVDDHPCDPVRPRVRPFYVVEQRAFVDADDVATDAAGDPIVRFERGDYWFGGEWPAIVARLGTPREAQA